MPAGEIHLVYRTMLKKGMAVCAFVGLAFSGLAVESDGHLTAGGRNDGAWQRTIPKPAKLLWEAPYDKGLDAFTISWWGGSAGTARIVDTPCGKGIEIAKTNDVGIVCIRPKETYAVPTNVCPKAFAAVVSSSENFEFARGELKVGVKGKERISPTGAAGLTVSGTRRMTWMPNTPPGGFESKYAIGDPAREGDVHSTCIYITGAASRSTWCAWRVEDAEAARLAAIEGALRKPFLKSRTFKSEMMPKDDFERKVAADTEHYAKVRMKDGCPRFFIDGEEAPPILYRGIGCPNGFARFAGGNLAKGVPLMLTPIDFRSVPPRKGIWHEDGFEAEVAVEEVRTAMRCSPDSMFVLGIGLAAYPTFTKRHPEETWRTEDGRLVCGNFNIANKTIAPGETPPKGYWPWVSYHSLLWREQAKTNMTKLVAALQKSGLTKRIVGVHLFGFHDGQFALAKADYSRPAVEAYRRWTGRAGAYVPVEPNALEVDMNGDFISVHALRNGTFDFKLPFPCRVTNVKSGQEEQVHGDTFNITVEAGQTCWFTLSENERKGTTR